jgi:uncharacterized membrane protein
MGERVDDETSRGTVQDPAGPRPTYSGTYGEPIAPWRQSLDSGVTRALDGAAEFLPKHWLFIVNTLVGIFAFLPFIAPVMLAAGLTGPANLIYVAYSYTCHQMPSRSWYILGEKMAYCQRDALIYPTIFFAGLYLARHRTIRPLGFGWFLLMLTPIALDGFTQLFGLRESTPLLRAITGTIFGIATVWFFYSHVQRVMDEGTVQGPASPDATPKLQKHGA